jgi:phosphatidylserine decarboxylase
MRFAREGYPYMAGAAAVTVGAWLAGWTVVALVALVVTALVVNFFRDPEREIPPGETLVTSPADGKVVAVESGVREDRPLKRDGLKRVSIFMSPLDVHVNRAPVDGMVVDVRHQTGKFHAAFLDKASELNEQNAVVVEDPRGERVMFVQIAGQLARRIVCRVRPGDRVRRGERYGMIMFGSRLDLYLPAAVDVRVRVGDRVSAGTTVIGAYA